MHFEESSRLFLTRFEKSCAHSWEIKEIEKGWKIRNSKSENGTWKTHGISDHRSLVFQLKI